MTIHRPTSFPHPFDDATLKSPKWALAWRGHAPYGLRAERTGRCTGHLGQVSPQTRIAGCTQDSSEEVSDALFEFDKAAWT